jgi:RNA polymerase sigma-70 factor (ECF subfamily)
MVRRRKDQQPVATAPEQERADRMAAAQRGDAVAYAALLTSLLPPLRAFVHRRGVVASEVEDVVQEILISIHRARHSWEPDRPFDPWLWAIARNASTDALRRLARERERRDLTADRFEASAPAAADPARDPEHQLAAHELAPELAAALGRLPKAQREAVELLYVEQLSVAEAAARAGVSAAALRVRAHRGSRALRRALRTGSAHD